jgi:hypothetical protein
LKVLLEPINNTPSSLQINYSVSLKNQNFPVKSVECILNSSSKHPNCISILNKQINNKTKDVSLEIGCPVNVSQVGNFYNDRNYVDTISRINDSRINEYCKLFTQKRLGDSLQAEICKRVQTEPIECVKYNSETSESVNKIVLVTIDRMLFAYGMMIGIPVIYDHGLHMTCFYPLPLENQNLPPPPPPPESQPTKNRKTGGNRISFDEYFDFTYIFEEPYVFYTFIPFIIAKYKKREVADFLRIYKENIITNSKEQLSTMLIESVKKSLIYEKDFENYIDSNSDFFINFINLSNEEFSIKCTEPASVDKNVTLEIKINNKTFTQVIKLSELKGIIEGSSDKPEFYEENIKNIEEIETFFINNGNISIGGDYVNTKNPLIKVKPSIFNKDEILNKPKQNETKPKELIEIITQSNIERILNYLSIYRMYEARLCLDVEKLEQDFDEVNYNSGYYVANDSIPYLFFSKLIEEHKDYIFKKSEIISLLLIEEILKDIEPYLYYKIIEIKLFVLGEINNEKEKEKINKLLENESYKKINENTKKYLIELIKIIKNENIKQPKKFDRYSFLYMYEDFIEKNQEYININSNPKSNGGNSFQMKKIKSKKQTKRRIKRKSISNKKTNKITRKYKSI